MSRDGQGVWKEKEQRRLRSRDGQGVEKNKEYEKDKDYKKHKKCVMDKEQEEHRYMRRTRILSREGQGV